MNVNNIVISNFLLIFVKCINKSILNIMNYVCELLMIPAVYIIELQLFY